MSDPDLLHFVLRSSYAPISPSFNGPVFFGACDVLRLMSPHGWNRSRISKALADLVVAERVRCCPVEGFGGNVHVYGLTTQG